MSYSDEEQTTELPVPPVCYTSGPTEEIMSACSNAYSEDAYMDELPQEKNDLPEEAENEEENHAYVICSDTRSRSGRGGPPLLPATPKAGMPPLRTEDTSEGMSTTSDDFEHVEKSDSPDALRQAAEEGQDVCFSTARSGQL